MFNKEDKSKPAEAETIIGPSVKVSGEFNGQGDIVVDGIFEGTLKTASGIYVGDKAKIKANIEAREGNISGEIIGNIKLKGHLEVGPVAKISGDLEVTSLSVARGAILNGKITMTNSHAAKAEKNEKSEE